MSDVTFRPAVRENLPLLLGLAGGTGSGKTFSAMELATGITSGQRFAVIDTENGRASHYADRFNFDVADLRAPFRPSVYSDAITAADEAGYPVVVVDSASHEWYGDGGCLDWHDELMGGDQKKNLSAWIQPKREHKQMVTRLLQVRAHVILAFRAEPKVEAVRDAQENLRIEPKASLVGLDGWIPIAEKNLPYELTASFLLMADKPGVPKPIKLPTALQPLVPLDAALDATVGRALAEWAAGGTATVEMSLAEIETELLALADAGGNGDAVREAIEKKRDAGDFGGWLRRQFARAQAASIAETAAA